jgi:hypothetical protein
LLAAALSILAVAGCNRRTGDVDTAPIAATDTGGSLKGDFGPPQGKVF